MLKTKAETNNLQSEDYIMSKELQKQDADNGLNKDQLAEISAVRAKLRDNGLSAMADSLEIDNDIKIATVHALMAKEDAMSLESMKARFSADEKTLKIRTANDIGKAYGSDMFTQAMSEIGNSPSKSLSLASMKLHNGNILEAKYTVTTTDPDSKERSRKLKIANDIRETAKKVWTSIGLKNLCELMAFKAGTADSKSATIWKEKYVDAEKGEFNTSISVTYRQPNDSELKE